MSTVRIESQGAIRIVTIDRPDVRNAVDGPTAAALAEAFRGVEADHEISVAILTGASGAFCAGADLKQVATGAGNRVDDEGDGPMGPTRMLLSKPVIAAVEGPAVAGGLELALWCDLRVVARDAIFGVYCRRFGVPLIDGGTIRLPRLVGHGVALDLILTGRPVAADEALRIGLASRVVDSGQALAGAIELAESLVGFPQRCLRNDRLSTYRQWGLDLEAALREETRFGREVLESGETLAGARRFDSGVGRHGRFD